MLRHGILALVLLGLFNSNLRADDSQYTYRVRIPQSQKSCDQEAALLATRFARTTGVKEVQGVCQSVIKTTFDGQAFSLYALVVNYKATKEVYPYSGFLGDGFGSSTPSNAAGAYGTYASCISDLAQQVTLYQSHTGLNAVAAFCSPGMGGIGANYVLQIDSFGKPKHSLFVFDPTFNSLVDSQYLQSIKDLIGELGGAITFIKSTEIFYYSEKPLYITHQNLGFFKVAEECASQLEYVRSMIASLGSSRILLKCLPTTGSSTTVALEVVRERVGNLFGDMAAGSQKYYSFDECLADRDRAVNADAARGLRTLGGLCRRSYYSSDIFVLEIFERP